MNPGLAVKLRPTGPWRIGPDSGARNRVDAVYHSDSLYSAVTSAMARLASLDEWLEATARSAAPAVCFSSCFPFLDEIRFVAPPRTIWPPASIGLRAAQVRWKSARFVPLTIVQLLLAGKALNDNDWSVDGASECLVPAGRPGPFRTGVRWSAAVDRLSGATERHSTACAEFRAGAGLWTVVSFANQAAGERWKDPVKAAFRLLADSGFGGERSRGWGRSEAPEFVEGALPDMILGAAGSGAQREPEQEPQPPVEEPSPVQPVNEPPAGEPPVTEPPADPDTEREPPEPIPEPSSTQESGAPGAAESSAGQEPAVSREGGEAAGETERNAGGEAAVEPRGGGEPEAGADAAGGTEPNAGAEAAAEPSAGGDAGGVEASAAAVSPAGADAAGGTEPNAGAEAAVEPPAGGDAGGVEASAAAVSPAGADAAGGTEPNAGAEAAAEPSAGGDAGGVEGSAAAVSSAGADAAGGTEPNAGAEAAAEPSAGGDAGGVEGSAAAVSSAGADAAGGTEPNAGAEAAVEPPAGGDAAGEPDARAGRQTIAESALSPTPAQQAGPVAPSLRPLASEAGPPPARGPEAHWLLSLFTPAAADTVDWRRGNYTVLARGGRVESPAGSGELKKQVKMVTEGSVLYAASAPRGAASDVAPDGFAHPVFRAGFALSIPLPEVELMRYRLTCLSPTLVGDGRKLSPIDYMVWKDHVNVLDQWRIFRLLAKGPRLEGYLTELKKADKLDFAHWGGFAQNFAGRRIPFENAAYPAYWNRAMGESLHIPTFAAGASGPYLPGTAIKGALRTGMVFANWRDGMLQDVAGRVKGDRPPRRPAENVEEQALGPAGVNRMRFVSAGDSGTIEVSQFKIYLLRTSTLQPRGANFALGWKQSPRGTVDGARPDDSTPMFAEMAAPGTWMEGDWDEKTFFLQPEVRRSVRWPEGFNRARLFEAVNVYAAGLLALQRNYAAMAGMGLLDQNLAALEQRLAGAQESGRCLMCLGWGGGLTAKSAWLDTTNSDYRQILRQYTIYNQALATNLPFPKTRRIVFLDNKPATLPGWAELSIS